MTFGRIKKMKKSLIILGLAVSFLIPSSDFVAFASKSDLPFEHSLKLTRSDLPFEHSLELTRSDLPFEHSLLRLNKSDLPFEH